MGGLTDDAPPALPRSQLNSFDRACIEQIGQDMGAIMMMVDPGLRLSSAQREFILNAATDAACRLGAILIWAERLPD